MRQFTYPLITGNLISPSNFGESVFQVLIISTTSALYKILIPSKAIAVGRAPSP